MQISKIERQKKNPQRYSLFIHDEYAFGVDEQVLLNFSIHKGMSLNQELIEKILKAEFQQAVYLKALNYLSYGLRSEKEVADYLQKLPLLQVEDLDTNRLFKIKPIKHSKSKKNPRHLKTDYEGRSEEGPETQVRSTSLRLKPSSLSLDDKEQALVNDQAKDTSQSLPRDLLDNVRLKQEENPIKIKEIQPDMQAASPSKLPLDKDELINSIIEATIIKLKDQNLINDKLFGEAYLRTQATINRKGPLNIGNELRRKGLDPFLIEDVLMIYDPDQMQENLQEVAEKFIRTKKLPEKMLKMKLQQHLMQKGYPKEAFTEFLLNYQVEVDEEEENELLNKDALKSTQKRRRKLAGYELKQKVFQDLLVKGYEYSLIQNWLEDHQEEFEIANQLE